MSVATQPQLDPGVLQGLVQPVGFLGALAQQRPAPAGPSIASYRSVVLAQAALRETNQRLGVALASAWITDRLGRHKTRAQQVRELFRC
jgi:hypothetical protein